MLLHALIDALLGALAMGDIGTLFPDTDSRWKGASSSDLLARAYELVLASGATVINVDMVVDLQRPKLSPHREAIRSRIAELLGVSPGQVSMKAKTGEGVGPVGEGLAISAAVVVLIECGEDPDEKV